MSFPLTLAIDTARDRLQLAIARADGTTDAMVLDIARGHAEKIMDCIGALLARNGLGYGDLERIGVTTGPGSFTGVRIGLSVARALGLARSIPVIGVQSLVALSLGGQGAHTIVLDAKRGEAYVQAFASPGVAHAPAQLLALEVALAQAGKHEADTGFVDVERLAQFAQGADPHAFAPDPCYIRAADAKPQTKGKVARA